MPLEVCSQRAMVGELDMMCVLLPDGKIAHMLLALPYGDPGGVSCHAQRHQGLPTAAQTCQAEHGFQPADIGAFACCPQTITFHLHTPPAHYEIWEYCQSTSKVQA